MFDDSIIKPRKDMANGKLSTTPPKAEITSTK